jgi:hypothetical protein
MPPQRVNDTSFDIVLTRDAGGIAHVNIPQMVAYHSPTGFEWGYGGSGPADLALNILVFYVGMEKAWKLHQHFKWDFIAVMPKEGGVIKKKDIERWLAAKEAETC